VLLPTVGALIWGYKVPRRWKLGAGSPCRNVGGAAKGRAGGAVEGRAGCTPPMGWPKGHNRGRRIGAARMLTREEKNGLALRKGEYGSSNPIPISSKSVAPLQRD
jgi:hypothetical protein